MSVRDRRIEAFLQLAEEELLAARLLMRDAPRQAAYLCQQCAEKVARAVLTDAGVTFGTGHSLEQMAVALPEAHPWVEPPCGGLRPPYFSIDELPEEGRTSALQH